MVDHNARYLLCNIQETNFAIPASQILHIGDVPYITRVPLTPPSMRGVINLRGNVIPVIDLRMFFNMTSLQEEVDEFKRMLDLRKEEHQEWVNSLMDSIVNDTPFTKPRNHHDCTFGKWYYHFETTNKSLEMLVKRFRLPHKNIHELADITLSLKEQGNKEEAIQLISEAKNTTLKQLNDVFHQVKEHYADANRALSIIVNTGNYKVGFLVDSVHSVERFNDSQYDSMKGSEFQGFLAEYADGLYKKEEHIYYSLIPQKIIVEAMDVDMQTT